MPGIYSRHKMYGSVLFIPYLFSPFRLSLKHLAHCFFFFVASVVFTFFYFSSFVGFLCWFDSINKIPNISYICYEIRKFTHNMKRAPAFGYAKAHISGKYCWHFLGRCAVLSDNFFCLFFPVVTALFCINSVEFEAKN